MKTALIIAPLLALAATLPAAAQTAPAQTAQTAPATQESGNVVRDVTDTIKRELGVQPTQQQQQQQQQQGQTTVLTGSYLREVDDDEPLLGPGNMTVRQMEDAYVFDARGKRIGEVEEVIANNRGQIVGLTVEVGGFLGMGDKEVLVPLEHLTVQNGQFRTNLTADQLKALPRWDDD